MKKVATVLFIVSLTLMACKKKKYCYQCSAQGIADFNSTQLTVKQECDLSKKDRDERADDFESAYPSSDWNISCSRTSD